MEALPLNSGEYRGTYKLIGLELSLDFVNTISWPGQYAQHDWLEFFPENFLIWAQALKLVDKATSKKLRQKTAHDLKKEFREVKQIRKLLTELLTPISAGKRPTPMVIKKVVAKNRAYSWHKGLNPKTLAWEWEKPKNLREILGPIIENALTVVAEMNHDRLKSCAACDWLYYDKTKNATRKWCDMEDCGSRDKALKYYHRKKTK